MKSKKLKKRLSQTKSGTRKLPNQVVGGVEFQVYEVDISPQATDGEKSAHSTVPASTTDE